MTSEKKTRFTPTFALLSEARKKLSVFKYRILVMSGKGGVGKSLVSTILALGLAHRGRKVALLDADIHGSSIPQLLNIQNKRHYANEKGEIIPVKGPLGIEVVAVNMMLDTPDTPVAWRGPLLARGVIELAARTKWSSGEYLVVDMPPGTGDIPITILQLFPDATGVVVVSSPGPLSEIIVAKAINFIKSTKIRIIGIVENMGYFKCPYCGGVTRIMGSGTAVKLSEKYQVDLLGEIPLDPLINEYIEKGELHHLLSSGGDVSRVFLGVVDKVINLVENTDK